MIPSPSSILSDQNIDYVVHISDVHIRNTQRHDEYEEVFRRTYQIIKTIKDRYPDKHGICFLGGDIVHAKLDMSPELVKMTSTFLRETVNLLPTVLIAGNHDCNLKNSNRLDVLTPLVELIAESDTPNTLYYLRDSGVYTYGNVDFIVWSVFDSSETYPSPKDIKTTNKKVVLYHGTVNNATTDTNLVLYNTTVTQELFNGCYCGLLGDIHKYQFMDKDHRVAYPGTLVQQNHGEALSHGFLLWDFSFPSKPQSKFFKVENDYGFVTIEMDNGTVLTDIKSLPKKPRIRIKATNTPGSSVQEVVSTLRSQYEVEELSIINDAQNKNSSGEITILDKHISHSRVPTYQNELIRQFIDSKFGVQNDEVYKAIEKLNGDINATLNTQSSMRNIVWKPLRFTFSNMFAYGESNTITFESMKGVYGIFAPNSRGKSSIFDSLMFCLFDKCSRTSKSSQILNNRSENFSCSLVVDIDGKVYRIDRSGEYDSKGNVPVSVRFCQIHDDGSETDLSGKDRDATNEVIRGYIGTYEDFVLTAMSTQSNPVNFVDKAQRERKDILSQFMDIDIYEELYKESNEQLKSLKGLLKEYASRNYTDELASAKEKYVDVMLDKKSFADSLDDVSQQIEQQQKLIQEGESAIEIIDASLQQLSKADIEKTIESLRTRYGSVMEQQQTIEGAVTEKKNKLDVLEGDIASITVTDEMKSSASMMTKIQKSIVDVDTEITKCQRDIELYSDMVHKLKHEYEYDPNCKYCVNNLFVQDAMNAEKSLPLLMESSSKLIKKRESLEQEYDECKRLNDTFQKYEGMLSDKKMITYTLNDYDVKLKGLKLEQAEIDTDIVENQKTLEKLDGMGDTIIENAKKLRTVSKLKEELKELYTKQRDINTKLMETSVTEGKIETIIHQCEEALNRLGELEKQYRILDMYVKAVHRDGVPQLIISTSLPLIEANTNTILSAIVPFQVMFTMDGKSILTHLVYDDARIWSLELAAGMEKFVASLAIRTALTRVTSLPKPNFIAIDEGFGVADSANMINMGNLFDYFKTQFDFVVVVSHIDAMRDMVDSLIEISTENGFSVIDA